MKKTILITGSTDGIGKLAAIQLAKDEHQVYLHGRNMEKLQKVLSEVKAQSGNKNTGSFAADFSDLAAVQKMAEQIKL
jgi:short-subunit dehydrogenase